MSKAIYSLFYVAEIYVKLNYPKSNCVSHMFLIIFPLVPIYSVTLTSLYTFSWTVVSS